MLVVIWGGGAVGNLFIENPKTLEQIRKWDQNVIDAIRQTPPIDPFLFYRNARSIGLFQLNWGVTRKDLYPKRCLQYCQSCASLLDLDKVECSLDPAEITPTTLANRFGELPHGLCALAEARCFEVQRTPQSAMAVCWSDRAASLDGEKKDHCWKKPITDTTEKRLRWAVGEPRDLLRELDPPLTLIGMLVNTPIAYPLTLIDLFRGGWASALIGVVGLALTSFFVLMALAIYGSAKSKPLGALLVLLWLFVAPFIGLIPIVILVSILLVAYAVLHGVVLGFTILTGFATCCFVLRLVLEERAHKFGEFIAELFGKR